MVLTNTAHNAAWDELADLTPVDTTNITESLVCTVSSSAQTNGTYKLVLADKTLTATGAVGPFQYVYLYDDNSTGDKLIGYYNYGSPVTMAAGDTFVINFDDSNGVLTIA